MIFKESLQWTKEKVKLICDCHPFALLCFCFDEIVISIKWNHHETQSNCKCSCLNIILVKAFIILLIFCAIFIILMLQSSMKCWNNVSNDKIQVFYLWHLKLSISKEQFLMKVLVKMVFPLNQHMMWELIILIILNPLLPIQKYWLTHYQPMKIWKRGYRYYRIREWRKENKHRVKRIKE